VSKNRALRRIFGPKMKEAAEGLKRLRNDELLNFYAPSSIIRVMK
jgi:hypothetical protein